MRALSSAQAPPKPRSPASKCAALRRGSGQLQRHCDCGGIIRFPDSPAPSACAFSSGNSITAGLQACQMRFCSPILMRHDVLGKELGEFSGFSNADFRGKMNDRGICDFSPEPLFAMRGFRVCGRDQRALRSPFGNLRSAHSCYWSVPQLVDTGDSVGELWINTRAKHERVTN